MLILLLHMISLKAMAGFQLIITSLSITYDLFLDKDMITASLVVIPHEINFDLRYKRFSIIYMSLRFS